MKIGKLKVDDVDYKNGKANHLGILECESSFW